ncbi:MAG TPA: hypothetical protein VF338_10320 [Leptolinea sp.]
MIKKILPFLLVASIFLTAAVPAQTIDSGLQVNQMEIDIWPEYDQPSTLVIYRISFSSLTSFPSKVSFKIPASAGDPYSVAMKDLDGLLYDLEYSVIPDGSWNRIEFITSTPDIQLEFYDPVTLESNKTHAYSFRWVSDYPVNDLKLVVQKPKYATGMTIQPDFGSGLVNSDDNLTYYTADAGNIKLGEIINVSITYPKTGYELSASILPVRAVNPLSQKPSIWKTILDLFKPIWENSSLLIAGGLLFAGILMLLLVFLLSTQKKFPRINPPENSESTIHKRRSINTSETLEVYCHICGKRAHPGDLYCRSCGSKLILR